MPRRTSSRSGEQVRWSELDRERQRAAERLGPRCIGDVNVELALRVALEDLQKLRKRLMHDTYDSRDAPRLL